MLNKLKTSGEKINSKFIQAVSITAMAIIILLKPGIAKGDENLDKELSGLLKKNPDKELIIQENQNDDTLPNPQDSASYTSPNHITAIPPDTNEVKNFFLKTRVLETEFDRKEFLQAWNEAKKSPNRDPLWVTIQDIFEVKDDSIRTAIYIFALIDPNKKTNLGKEAWLAIESNPKRKNAWIAICSLYVSNIKLKQSEEKLKQSEEKLKQSEEILKSLKEISKIYQDYINSHKLLLFI